MDEFTSKEESGKQSNVTNASNMNTSISAYMPIPHGLHSEQRLHQIVVFELREDGATEYSSMTLRALYNHVVRTITEACRQANLERHHHYQQKHQQNKISSKRQRERIQSVGYIDGSEIGVIEEEDAKNTDDNHHNDSPNPTTPSSYPVITPSEIPPHLPSLTSSNATTPHHDSHHGHHHEGKQSNMRQPYPSYTQQHHLLPQRAAQTAFTPLPNNNAHRERLGGYLHPRDMRRLVTPFSSSNEPQLMVRRHVMLLNFDPLRAIVLKDRCLVLVPDGADSILIELERRVRGGIVEMENQVFGVSSDDAKMMNNTAAANLQEEGKGAQVQVGDEKGKKLESTSFSDNSTEHTECDHSSNTNHDEWEDIQKMDWKHMPYELQSVDAVLQTVTSMLLDDARKLGDKSVRSMSELRGDHRFTSSSISSVGEHAQERLRLHKDEVNLMEGRVQGFVRAMNEVLDDDEDMALMNLSRLISHPDRFLQPVSQEILHEESDEPELILEAYLQEALSIVNELDLLKGQITSTEEQISMTLDSVRNRLLYINTLLSVASLCVGVGSFVGSIFGMNLTNHIEQEEKAFLQVTVGVIVGMVGMWGILSWVFYRAANNIHFRSSKKTM